MIWKNVFYNLTIILWRKFVWYCKFGLRKVKWQFFLKPHFYLWTKKAQENLRLKIQKAIDERNFNPPVGRPCYRFWSKKDEEKKRQQFTDWWDFQVYFYYKKKAEEEIRERF